jgi:hypothetical protein
MRPKKYRKISPQFWNDRRVRNLTDNAKLSLLFMLTHPHMTPLGAIRANLPGLACELGWSAEGFREAFEEALAQGMVQYDERACLLWFPNFIKHNLPESPNVIKSWVGGYHDLPECDLKDTMVTRAYEVVSGMSQGFRVAFREAFAEALPQAIANQEQEQEQEQEEEKRASCEASSPSADGDTSRPAPEQPETTCEVEDTEPTPEAPKKAACPYKRIVEAYNVRLGQYLPTVRELTDKRKKHVRARWQSNPERQSVEWWDSYFEYVSRSPFLCGQKNGFRANFDWLVNPSNLTKVVEGTYHDQAEASAKGAPKGKQSVSEKNRSVFERLAAEG